MEEEKMKENVFVWHTIAERCPRAGEYFLQCGVPIMASFDFQTLKETIVDCQVIEVEVTKDGDQVCYLFGENLQEGIAGFGDTKEQAKIDFLKNYHTEYDKI